MELVIVGVPIVAALVFIGAFAWSLQHPKRRDRHPDDWTTESENGLV